MIKIEAVHRLLAEKQVTDPPNNDKNMEWQKKQKDSYRGKPKPPPGQQTPKGTFTQKNPADVVNDLKRTSTDYGQASKRLNNYINRSGENLDMGTKQTLYKSKDDLKDAYGVDKKPEPVKPVEPQPTQSSVIKAGPQYIPRDHIGNQLTLDTGLDDSVDLGVAVGDLDVDDKTEEEAVKRLLL